MSKNRGGPKTNVNVFRPKDYERPGLTEDEILEIKEAFDLFDPDKTGYINPKDLKETMDSLGFDDRSKIIYEMLQNYEDDCETQIDFKEFLDLMTAKMTENDSKEDIKKVFKLFDEEGNGYVTIEDLKRVAKELSENMETIEMQEMITRADSDADGRVTFEDFYNIMTKKTFI